MRANIRPLRSSQELPILYTLPNFLTQNNAINRSHITLIIYLIYLIYNNIFYFDYYISTTKTLFAFAEY